LSDSDVIRITAPIVIYAFDRPHYLDRVCRSLAGQRRVAFAQNQLHLVQDGAISPRTGRRYGEDAAIEGSVATFLRHFPRANVWTSPDNLGIAFNVRRGEKLAFELLDAEVAYFFEDDLELGPLYLWAMEKLREQVQRVGGVAYFAAYGVHHRDFPGPTIDYVPMEHHWGFGLTREAWRRIDAHLAPYYALIAPEDYRERAHKPILRLYETLDFGAAATSQDAQKAMACLSLGLAKAMTSCCFARYIGEHGQSFSPEAFTRAKFDRMQINPREDYIFPALTAERVKWLWEYHLGHARKFRAERYEASLALHER
jgi:hypothetical protein